MTDACLSHSQLVDYLHGELDEPDEQNLELHLFGCRSCSTDAEGLAGLVSATIAMVPPILSEKGLASLERLGRVQAFNVMGPGQTAEVVYPEPGRVLVHRLGGAALEGVERVDLAVTTPSGDAVLRLEDVAVGAERGEVLVVCQSHFAEMFPRDIVVTVEHVIDEKREAVASYTIHHRTS